MQRCELDEQALALFENVAPDTRLNRVTGDMRERCEKHYR